MTWGLQPEPLTARGSCCLPVSCWVCPGVKRGKGGPQAQLALGLGQLWMELATSVAAAAFQPPPVWTGDQEHPYRQPPVQLPTLGCLYLK